MTLTFANFKQIIPGQILTRGREYLRHGQILDLSFDEEELVWEAQVEGTEVYDVRVELLSDGSLSCSCTCPYDMGEHCKHVAAVLYAVEEAYPDQLGGKPRKKPVKRQTRHDKLRRHLEKTSREQLVSILLELAQHDSSLLNQLLIHLDAGESKPMDYRRVVKDALRTGRGDYGFLDYAGANRAGRKISELLHQAGQWRSAGQIDKAVSVYQAVIDETVVAIAQADDSSGSLGGCIATSIEGLSEIASLQGEPGREALFVYCLDRVRRSEFQSWDWRWDLLQIAEEQVSSPAQRALFTSALDDIEAEASKPSASGYISSYSLEQIALFRLALIDRFDGPEAYDQFLRANVHLDRIRMEWIERCITEGDLEEAMRQIQAGIASSDQRRLPGLTNQYQALRVKLLQQKGDKTAVIDGARALWLDRAGEDDFELLRQMVPAAEWAAFVDRLIKDTRRSEQRAWLYARENRWRDLMTLVQTDIQGAWLIDPYRDQLESRFPEEVAALYEKIVNGILVNASNRGTYQRAAAYLRQMKKIGQEARAQALVQRIRAKYSSRPALLDELRKL
ncbi:MAG: SWIM zinc finger family protein [Anaerolineae bacterium]|nr:SWIM zinc finger family protein [Anaerolineae bacterium]NUQ04417.1 SWIM zinc finger family protein [Anaerolineae bacterium]